MSILESKVLAAVPASDSGKIVSRVETVGSCRFGSPRAVDDAFESLFSEGLIELDGMADWYRRTTKGDEALAN